MAPPAGFRAGLVAVCFAASGGHVAAQHSVTPPPAGSARVVLSIDKPTFFAGENVLIHYCLENTASTPFQISYGGDSRGASRSLRFKMTLTDDHGTIVADPDPTGYNEGGIGAGLPTARVSTSLKSRFKISRRCVISSTFRRSCAWRRRVMRRP